MNKVRVRVEAKRLPQNTSKQDREWNLIKLLRFFKRVCEDYGIPHALKEHEFFIRKCDKKRRKKMARRIASKLVGKTEKQGEEW